MKTVLISFILYSLIGTILHFLYKLTNKNIAVAIFSSVNESVWEHIKILLTPILLVNTIKYVMGYQKNYFIALFLELFLAISLIIILYKLKKYFYGDKKSYLNVLIFYVTSFICALVGHVVRNIYIPSVLNIYAIFLCLIIFLMYITFTIFPLKCSLFKDPVNGTYGIS